MSSVEFAAMLGLAVLVAGIALTIWLAVGVGQRLAGLIGVLVGTLMLVVGLLGTTIAAIAVYLLTGGIIL